MHVICLVVEKEKKKKFHGKLTAVTSHSRNANTPFVEKPAKIKLKIKPAKIKHPSCRMTFFFHHKLRIHPQNDHGVCMKRLGDMKYCQS